VILSLLKGENALCSHGNQERDFLHVQDVALAFVALLELAKETLIEITQAEVYAPIYVRLTFSTT